MIIRSDSVVLFYHQRYWN